MKTIVHFGIDVDDKSFHVTGRFEDGREIQFNCRPNAKCLAEKLLQFQSEETSIKACYEAGYLGFSLYRTLKELGIDVEVIAPASIPKSGDQQIKNDRLDSQKIAQFYQLGLLTIVHPPEEEDEIIRDLCRSRQFLIQQQNAIRLHLNSLCRRLGWNFRQDSGCKTLWRDAHIKWLQSKLKATADSNLKFNLSQLLTLLESIKLQIEQYSARIKDLSETEKYKTSVEALNCYRGIDTLSAMSLVIEIGDIKRFKSPRALMSFIGLDVREYSSGGRQRQFGITKLGNKYLRKTLVESAQSCSLRPTISYKLKLRRKQASAQAIATANKCMHRLYKKSSRMLLAGKNTNKVKVACARELAGFIWGTLQQSQAGH